MSKKNIDYSEVFIFPDIPWQSYPVYNVSKSGKVYNFRSIIYPSPKSCKKFTRMKQLKRRSQQAKMFDMLINIGYFDPLTPYVVKEFPVIIQNHLRTGFDFDISSGYIMLDYFFANLKDGDHWGLDVELDSDLHDPERDKKRDEYLESLGVKVFRISHLEREQIQKKEFPVLRDLIKGMEVTSSPRVFSFSDNIKLANKKG